MVVISSTEHRASASRHGQIQNEMFEAMMGVPAKFCPSPPKAKNKKQETRSDQWSIPISLRAHKFVDSHSRIS